MRGMCGLALMLLIPIGVWAGDWPQWLGPQRDSGSTEKVTPWQGELKIVWKQPVGEGHSSPIVAQGKVYLHTKVKDKNEEELAAFDAITGKPLWNQTYERPTFKSLFGNGPRGTPALVDGKIYTYGITGMLTCFEADTGKQAWQVDALKEFQATNLFFGASGSPLIEGDKVVLNVGGQGASIVAFDKNTGKTAWQKLDDKASYSSGIATGQGNNRQVIFLTAKGLVSLAPADGKVFWQHPLVDKLSESSTTPVVAGDILFGSSVTFGGLGLKMEKASSGPQVKEVWMKPELNCYFATPVLVGKELYVVTATRPPALAISSTLRCIEPGSGKELWSRPKVGKYHASLLRTGDNKLLLLEEAGNLVLLDANPSEYKELARSKVCGTTWAHPALANGKLYIRDQKDLICVQLAE
jgi:outer membrane protein assembly factor BamB